MDYFRRIERPAGILRVQMGIFAELVQAGWARGPIRFCRLDREVDRFESVEFETLAKLFYGSPIARHRPAREDAPHPSESGNLWPGWLTRAMRRILRDRHRRSASLGVQTHSFDRGDILVCLGASWENPRYVKLVRRARRKLGVRFAILIHDIIPITDPQLASTGHLRMFERWLHGVLSEADIVWTISGHTRAALIRLAEQRSIAIPPVETLRPGTGFRVLATAADSRAKLELPAQFVLYVSTIEIRKNHVLLLRVWSHLIAGHGAECVPALVCVGRWGWLVNELSSELSTEGALRNKVLTLSGLSDAEVETAYRQCLFTVFPSLMEGWGLPVSESLAHGKLCVASNRGAIPEAGGHLVDYFDPDDEPGALAAIERAIFDRDYRLAREARIRAEFRPRSWRDCAAALISRLDRLYVETGAQSAERATTKCGSIAGAKQGERGFLLND
jgi:glycosyltransferase involved in cell wall biosynthesis